MTPHDDNHDRGLAFDVNTLMTRRRALVMIAGGVGAAVLAGCGGKDAVTSASTTTSAATTSGAVIPTETAGPYPGDGSNGPDVLRQSGIVRSDIRSSFGSASGVATGIPLTINLKVLDNKAGNTPYAGAAVYLWHCNIDGEYSMYGNEIAGENYLRGVQEADSDGNVSFKTIFPAAYDGRWPHAHFEIYKDLATATSSGVIYKTTQLAFPQDICEKVYATSGYERSARNLQQTSLASDMVFRDDKAASQLVTMTGSIDSGLVASLNVPV